MGKNKYGGNKAKRKKNVTHDSVSIIYKDTGQEYGRIDNALGNKRFSVSLPDGTNKLGILAGSLRQRINKDDIVLLSLWDFQDKKCSIIFKYNEEHINELIQMKEVNENFITNKNEMMVDENDYNPFEWDRSTEISSTSIKTNQGEYIDKSMLPEDEDEDEEQDINIDDI